MRTDPAGISLPFLAVTADCTDESRAEYQAFCDRINAEQRAAQPYHLRSDEMVRIMKRVEAGARDYHRILAEVRALCRARAAAAGTTITQPKIERRRPRCPVLAWTNPRPPRRRLCTSGGPGPDAA